jgi:hypothetical protein
MERFAVASWSLQSASKTVIATSGAIAALWFPDFVAARPVADLSLRLKYSQTLRLGTPSSAVSSAMGEPEIPLRFNASSADGARSMPLAGWSSARLVELPRTDAPGTAPGTYSRPRYALGFRSQAMRSWLNGLGIEATTCLAPLVRVRSKISSEGALSGTLWLSARCDIR